MAKIYKTFEQARTRFQRADLLLKRPTNWWGRAICTAGIGEHSHAAMLAARNGVWVGLDVCEHRGGSSWPLEKAIREQPGVWDHFSVNTQRFPEFDREAAELRMWQFDACDYGRTALLKASLIFLPGIRLFQKIESLAIDNGDTVDSVDEHGNPKQSIPPFCSMAYAIACDKPFGGVDPVKRLRHSMTTPPHLAQSHFVSYECTLVTKEWLERKAAA